MAIFNEGGWLKPSLLALFFWGLWGFLTKVGAEKVPWQNIMILFGICTFMAGIICGMVKPQLDGYFLASIGAGIAGAVGFLYFFNALSKGPASIVIPLTSLYVVVAAILAFLILAEPLSVRKILGIFSAIAAIALLAG